MKKYLLILVGAISLLGISSVKADTYTINYNLQNLPDSSLVSSSSEILSRMYEYLYEYYEDNYKEDYPYYFISLESFGTDIAYHTLFGRMYLIFFDVPVYFDYDSQNDVYSYFYNNQLLSYSSVEDHGNYIGIEYSNNAIQLPVRSYLSNYLATSIFSEYVGFYHNYLYYSNFDLKFSSSGGNNLVINNYLNSGNSLTISGGDIIPSYQNALNLNVISESSYVEVDLNNYSYVALSLKDYTERDEFSTNVEVQGQYCLTPVYDYGLTERKDIISGSRVQACSPYYESFTPVRTYILESDIKNHAIYYLKVYDTTRDNKVKVDTSIFNIHYITSEEEDNPILNINGRNYTPIPYDDLTDSATISEGEGYVSGVVCGVGDFNCMSEYTGFNPSDIFDKPLEFFKNLISSFVSVFTLVASLIAVLPLPMQWFLYLSFTLAIALGIIKIIL